MINKFRWRLIWRLRDDEHRQTIAVDGDSRTKMPIHSYAMIVKIIIITIEL